MRAHRIGFCLALAIATAAMTACAPQGTEVEESAAQAKQGDEGCEQDEKGGCAAGPGTPAPACTGYPLGDGSTCVDHADLEGAAVAACEAEEMILVDITVPFDCAGAASTFAKVTCCDSGEPAHVPSEPPDPAPSSPDGVLGDGTTCVANADYEQQAISVCAAMGLSLIDVHTWNDCSEDSSRHAKYICG